MKSFLFTIFTISALFCICTGAVFSATEDPFATLEKQINEVHQKITESGMKPECMSMYGKGISAFYKELTHTPVQQENEEGGKKFSSKYQATASKVDDLIFEKIVQAYPKSGLACSENGDKYVRNALQSIISAKNKIPGEVLNTPELYKNAEYGKEYDSSSKSSFQFNETKRLWEDLQEKIKSLKSAINSIKKDQGVGVIDFFHLTGNQKESIDSAAKSRAKEYVDAFWEGTIYQFISPLYSQRSDILKDLKKLPEKKGDFTSVWDGKYGEVLTEKAIQEIVDRQNANAEKNKKESTFLTGAVEEKKKEEKQKAEYKDKLDSVAYKVDNIEGFSESYTQATIQAIEPAKQSFETTEKALDAASKSLQKRNANQNRE